VHGRVLQEGIPKRAGADADVDTDVDTDIDSDAEVNADVEAGRRSRIRTQDPF
jgi:hypothetical protein